MWPLGLIRLVGDVMLCDRHGLGVKLWESYECVDYSPPNPWLYVYWLLSFLDPWCEEAYYFSFQLCSADAWACLCKRGWTTWVKKCVCLDSIFFPEFHFNKQDRQHTLFMGVSTCLQRHLCRSLMSFLFPMRSAAHFTWQVVTAVFVHVPLHKTTQNRFPFPFSFWGADPPAVLRLGWLGTLVSVCYTGGKTAVVRCSCPCLAFLDKHMDDRSIRHIQIHNSSDSPICHYLFCTD